MSKAPPSFENRQARRKYEITETHEAGLVLTGTEVKSLRGGKCEIADAHVVVKDGELFVLNLRIEPYEHGGSYNHEEKRTRKLLMKRLEIQRLGAKIREKQMAAVPLKVYFNEKGKVKLLLGLGKGKKSTDRREDEKKAQAKREMDRALKARR
ncbi:MAG: SsrA-binding protein SmpB [Leptospirales bacterium]|nr:SsrA-binding protein SmpB [Leptospirales bacterium]